jgi:BON domain
MTGASAAPAWVSPIRLLDPFDQREEAPEEWRRRLVTLGAAVSLALLALVAIVAVGAMVGAPSIERHLLRDIERSVLVDDPGVRAVVTGRTVSLSGSVPDRAERDRVIRRVAARWGVSNVRVGALKVAARRAGTTSDTSSRAATPRTSV